MNLICKRLNRRANNRAAMIAVYCSMPWLFFSNSHAKGGPHSTAFTVIAVCLVLGLALTAMFVCRKRCNAA